MGVQITLEQVQPTHVSMISSCLWNPSKFQKKFHELSGKNIKNRRTKGHVTG